VQSLVITDWSNSEFRKREKGNIREKSISMKHRGDANFRA